MVPLRTQHHPPQPGPRDEVRRIAGGHEAHYVILSPSFWGVWTHWHDGRTSPCTEPKDDCPGCRDNSPQRWKGYLYVWSTNEKKCLFLELTPLAAQLLQQQADPNQSLRGLSYQIGRGRGSKARLRVQRQYGRAPEEQLPPHKDPSTVLQTLWSMPTRQQNRFGSPFDAQIALTNGDEQ